MAVLDPVDTTALARIGVALADDNRRRLLLALLDGPRYPADLAAELGLGEANTRTTSPASGVRPASGAGERDEGHARRRAGAGPRPLTLLAGLL